MVKRLLPLFVLWFIFGPDWKLVGFIQTKTTTRPVIKGHSVYSMPVSTHAYTPQGVAASLSLVGADFIVYESSKTMVKRPSSKPYQLKKL